MDGVPAFFFPTRFSSFSLGQNIWENVEQQYSLLTGQHWPLLNVNHVENQTFPLPDPLGGRLHMHLAGAQQAHLLHRKPTIKIKHIHKLPLSTSHKSVTDTAPMIQIMPVEGKLHQVRRCPEFWQNLMSYASEFGQDNTFGNHTPPMAHREDQAIAICSLHGWFQRHLIHKLHLVNGEPAVQDVIQTQLLDFADNILQTRYRPTVIQGAGLHEGLPVDTYMPVWGRAVPDNHVFPNHGKSRAGYPDFILFYAPNHLSHAAVVEVKTWWAYTEAVLRGIFTSPVLTNNPVNVGLPPDGLEGGGFFDWESGKDSAKLLKQIWGQLQFFSVDWGMWTNGEEIIVYVITQRYNPQIPGTCNQLTFSDPMSIYTEDRVHHGFAGFCFASLDSNAAFNANGVANNPIPLVDTLCPPEVRLNPLQHPIA